MKKLLVLFVFLISFLSYAQIPPDIHPGGEITKFTQPDTLSTTDRDALTPKLGTILYHKDTGISQWEQWDGTSWVEFGALLEITGAASTIVTSDLTNNRALISNGSGKVAVSAVTSTELSYVGGVTSALQTQLNAKLNSSSYTAADVLDKLLTVDGSGSSIDADLLDGINGADYLSTAASFTKTAGFTRFAPAVQWGVNAEVNTSYHTASNSWRLDFSTNGIVRFRNSGFSDIFTMNLSTGNFTATGAGEFGGTVSGDDPVNNDDFVTKGYAESNFATVESGTWTPTLIDAGGGATYSGTFTGQYVKIGSMVTLITAFTSISTTGAPSGVLEIGNLPYTVTLASSGSVSEFFGGNVNFYSIASKSMPNITNRIRFIIQQDLDSSLATNMSTVTISSGQIRTTISYITND